MRFLITVFLFPFLGMATLQSERNLRNDATITFKIRNAGVIVEGRFSEISTQLTFDTANMNGNSVLVLINVKSIDTGIGLRDKHLKGKDYFNEAQFPQISFRSVKFEKADKPGTYIVKGRVNIKGIEKEVSLPFNYTNLQSHESFRGNFTLNRLDFKVGKSSWVLADEVDIFFKIETVK